MKDKKILITGGCGFVAGRIAEVLSAQNEVTVVDNMRYWSDRAVIPHNVRHVEWDLIDFYLDGVDYDFIIHGATVNIIHAMEDPKACVDTNWDQTVAFFDQVPEHIPVLYLSTSSVYGNGVQFPTTEECRLAPSNTYAMTKLMAEMYLLSRHKNSVVARLSNVYGPRQRPENPYSGVMVKMLESSVTGKAFYIYGDGSQTRDFTFVDDVVDACVALMEKGKRGQVYNVGTGIETSVSALCEFLPEGVDVVRVPGRPIDNIVRRCLSIDKIKMDTGWEPKVAMKDGVARTIFWLLGQDFWE